MIDQRRPFNRAALLGLGVLLAAGLMVALPGPGWSESTMPPTCVCNDDCLYGYGDYCNDWGWGGRYCDYSPPGIPCDGGVDGDVEVGPDVERPDVLPPRPDVVPPRPDRYVDPDVTSPDDDAETPSDAGLGELGPRQGCNCASGGAPEDLLLPALVMIAVMVLRRGRRRRNRG